MKLKDFPKFADSTCRLPVIMDDEFLYYPRHEKGSFHSQSHHKETEIGREDKAQRSSAKSVRCVLQMMKGRNDKDP